MKHTIFDVSSNGLSKHVTTNKGIAIAAHDPDVLSASGATDGGDLVTTFGFLRAASPFVALLFSVIAIFFIRPQIYCLREFFRACFKSKCWYGVWRQWRFDLAWFFVDVLTIAAVVDYFDSRDVFRTARDVSLYIAVLALVLLFLVFRWFWINSFWNYHNKKNEVFTGGVVVFDTSARIALGFALLFSILMLLTVIALFIVFGIARTWVSFGLLIPLFIWTILLLVWTALIFNCTGCERPCETPCETGCPPVVQYDACGRPIVVAPVVTYANQKPLNNKRS